MTIEIREMDDASDVQLARYDATKVARRSGKCTTN